MNYIFLTGGTSKRFGSDKSAAILNGKSLLEYATDGLNNLIVVGPTSNVNAIYVREVPEYSGPVAAISAGLQEVKTEVVGIFAIDMPFAPRIVSDLERALIHDASLPIDKYGFVQPLAGIYRTTSLRRALLEFESTQNQSMKSLISKLIIDEVPLVETELLMDIDTPEDYLVAIDLASRLVQ